MSKQAMILSHFGLFNYGQRLQGYAVVKLLEEYGVNSTLAAPYKSVLIDSVKDFGRRTFPIKGKPHRDRFKRFHAFVSSNTPYKRMSYDKLIENAARFDFCVVGSDQVWSPFYLAHKPRPELYFLPGIPAQRKIAFAPSFGVDYIPDEMLSMYEKGLKSFDRLSVRESSGADLINSIIGVDATVLTDPTVGLSREQWESIANPAMCPSDPYLLLYYLGDLTSEAKTNIERFAKERNLVVVNLMDKNAPFYGAGPAEFLGLIDNACYFITDSFHGTVFTLIFNTPFCVTRRLDQLNRDMFGRIEGILSPLGLEDRIWNSSEELVPKQNIDWEIVNQEAALSRARISGYLKEELIRCGVI